MEEQFSDLEESRNHVKETLDPILSKQKEIEASLKNSKKRKTSKSRDQFTCTVEKCEIMFYGIDEEKDETDKDCVDKVLSIVEKEL